MQLAFEQYIDESFWQQEGLEIMLGNEVVVPDFPEALIDSLKYHVLFQTSGSSGQSKWVALSKNALLFSAQKVCEHFEVWAGDVWGLCLPIHHVGGFGVLARAYSSGCGISHYSEKWDAKKAVEQMRADGVTLLSLVPAQVTDIVNAGIECPSSIRATIVGGGNLLEGVKKKATKLGWRIFSSYGMTETASQVATGDVGDGWLQTIDGWEFETTESGCLKVKGDGLLTAYVVQNAGGWQLEDALGDGWFETKDIVEVSEGKLRFQRRADRVVKILGELVDVSAFEQELSESLKIEVVLLELSDERRGVRLVPVVERALHTQEADLLARFSGLKTLEDVVVLQEGFPRSELGKILSKEVRKRVF